MQPSRLEIWSCGYLVSQRGGRESPLHVSGRVIDSVSRIYRSTGPGPPPSSVRDPEWRTFDPHSVRDDGAAIGASGRDSANDTSDTHSVTVLTVQRSTRGTTRWPGVLRDREVGDGVGPRPPVRHQADGGRIQWWCGSASPHRHERPFLSWYSAVRLRQYAAGRPSSDSGGRGTHSLPQVIHSVGRWSPRDDASISHGSLRQGA